MSVHHWTISGKRIFAESMGLKIVPKGFGSKLSTPMSKGIKRVSAPEQSAHHSGANQPLTFAKN
jgi:hypothetical protein